MEFKFLTTEEKETIDLVNECFNTNCKELSLSDNQRFLLLKENDGVAGCALLTLKIDPIKNKKTFYIDYFCVKETYRNKGLGSKMFDEIEKIAKKEKINLLMLTSNIRRASARKVYLKKGMTIVDTNLFIKEIKRNV